MKVPTDGVPALTIALGCLVSLVMYPALPGSTLLVAFGLPTAATVTYLILRGLWCEASGEGAIDAATDAVHRAIAVRLVVFTMALHVLVVLNLGGAPWIHTWGPRLVVVLFGSLIIAIGNLLPRTRPNLALGIRTTRTLNDRPLWIRIHRTAGHVAVALGAVIVVSGVFLRDPALELIVGGSALGSIATVAVTYYRQCHA